MRLTALRRLVSAIVCVVVLAPVAGVVCYDALIASPTPRGDPFGKLAPAASDAWPMFGGTNQRNMVNPLETHIPTAWSVEQDKPQNIKWSVALGTKTYNGVVIADGRIFIGTNNGNPRDPKITGDNGVLMCFDEKSGKFLWQHAHDRLASGRVNDWPSVPLVSNPVVEGDRLYYISNRCEVICARTSDGKIDWWLDMIGKLDVFPHNASTCSPLIAGNKLFVCTGNGVDESHSNIPQPEAPSFVAIDKHTGKVVWSDNAPTAKLVAAQKGGGKPNLRAMVNKGDLLMHGQWSSPVYAEPNGRPMVIFPGGDGWLRGFDPANGRLLWKFDCNPKSAVYELSPKATRNNFVATPVVWQNKLYVGVGEDPEHWKGVGHLWCIDLTKKPANADMDLSPVDDNFDPKAAVNKNSGLVWHYGGFITPEPKKGRKYHFGRTLSTCAVYEGLLYTADLDGHFYCIDALTGDLNYEHDMKTETWSSPYWVDGHVYIGNEDGQILVFKHGPKKELVNTIDMTDDGRIAARIRTVPVAHHGVLYVMTEDPCKLWAITPTGK